MAAELRAPPDPLAAVKGLGSPEGERRGREGREWRKEGREGEGKGEGTEKEGGEEGMGRGPQFKKNDPRHQMAGYGPVRTTCEVNGKCHISASPAPNPLGRFSKQFAGLIVSGTPPHIQVLGSIGSKGVSVHA